MDGDILEIGLGGGKGHAVAGDGPQAVDDACRQVAGAGHGPQEDLPLKGQEDRDYLLKELQGDAEKAGKAGNAVLRAAPAAVGGLDPGAGLTALAQEAVRPAEGAQHVKTGQQVLHFADALRLGGGAGLAQPFHPLLEQLGHHQHHRCGHQSRRQHEPVQGDKGQNAEDDQSGLLDAAEKGGPGQVLHLLDVGGQPGDVLAGVPAVVVGVGLVQQGEVQVPAYLVVHIPDGPGLQDALQRRQGQIKGVEPQVDRRPEQEAAKVQADGRVELAHHHQLNDHVKPLAEQADGAGQGNFFPVLLEIVLHVSSPPFPSTSLPAAWGTSGRVRSGTRRRRWSSSGPDTGRAPGPLHR